MKRTKYILILLLLQTIVSCDFKSAQDYYDDALKFEEQQKYSDAIKMLDNVIEKEPNFLGAILNRGADKSALEKYDEAIKDYELILSKDKNNTMALFNIACNKKRLNDYQAAVNYYNKALETKGGKFFTTDLIYNPYFPNDKALFDVNTFDIIYERGLAYYKLDSLNKARNDFYSCVKNNSHIVNANFHLAETYFKANRIVIGCEYLHKAIELGYKDISPDQLRFCDSIQSSAK